MTKGLQNYIKYKILITLIKIIECLKDVLVAMQMIRL